jgi:hypothetical protein
MRNQGPSVGPDSSFSVHRQLRGRARSAWPSSPGPVRATSRWMGPWPGQGSAGGCSSS